MDRHKRLESIIYRNIVEIIQFSLDTHKLGLITINEVVLSKDYSYAKVYVTFLGSKYPYQDLEVLSKAKGYIRHELSQRMETRKIPNLEFVLDETYEKSKRIEELLEKEEKQIETMKKPK